MKYRSTFAPSLLLIVSVFLACSALGVRDTHADFNFFFTRSVTGTFLLKQDNNFLRLVTIFADRNFASISQEPGFLDNENPANFFVFSNAQGAWKRTGAKEITAKGIDFDFQTNVDASDDIPFRTATTVTQVIFILEFADEVNWKFQTATGRFFGKSFDKGENPLPHFEEDDADFSGTFIKGQRVNVK